MHGLAHNAVEKKWVSIAYPGCWVVRGTDGVPYTVTLYPKQTCSCSHSSCYHVMACKIMVGEEFEGTKKANAALLHQSNRRKTKEKPSGRKQPRKKDFDNDTTRKGI